MISQISTSQKIHHKVEALPILKSVIHIHNKRVFEVAQQDSLIHNGVDWLLSDNFCLEHLFHGVCLLGTFKLDTPDLTEASFANHIVIGKVMLIYNFFSLRLLFVEDTGNVNSER